MLRTISTAPIEGNLMAADGELIGHMVRHDPARHGDVKDALARLTQKVVVMVPISRLIARHIVLKPNHRELARFGALTDDTINGR
jgi:hypothetical protein